ncbi:MAG: hypothetical protein ABI294_02685 [Casimicrobiaceae bacterium]
MNATFDRARIARDAGPALALFAAVLLLAWAIAYWAWRWVTPAPVHVMPAEPSNPVAAIVASGWLASDAHAVADASAPATLAGDIRLLGVFAEANGGGYALFRLPSGPKLVKKGGEIASGSTLVDIAPWTIRIRDAGGERSIALLAATESAVQAAAPAGSLPPLARRAAGCTPPPGFSGQVVKLNAELLQGLATQPDALRAIVAPVAGGMSVREASGFAQMMGLKPGDRVRLANGIPLASADDVMAAVLTPLLANQPVRLSGTRDGQAREMLLLNAGACPG